MSESRCGESRGFSFPSYSYNSESRSSESREISSYSSCSSESRECGESRTPTTPISYSSLGGIKIPSESSFPIEKVKRAPGTRPQKVRRPEDTVVPEKYNSFEDIDTLIDQLELTIPILEQLQSRGKQYSQSLKRRQAQIEKLRQIKEERIISAIERESDSFDEKIDEVKKLTKTPPSCTWWDWDSSESRDDEESRW